MRGAVCSRQTMLSIVGEASGLQAAGLHPLPVLLQPGLLQMLLQRGWLRWHIPLSIPIYLLLAAASQW